jgi:hypothetical protein
MYAYANPTRFIDPSGHYNRQAAVAYAMQYDGPDATQEQPDISDTRCTNMVSFALFAGWIRDPRPNPFDAANTQWYQDRNHLKYDVDDPDLPDEQKWQPPYWNRDVMLNAPFLNYKSLYLREWYVTDELVDFLIENGLADKITYTGVIPQFRHDRSGINRNNDNWVNFLKTNSRFIQPGDLVFYKWNPSGGPYQWDHAAMVTGWDYQTYVGEGETYNDPYESIARAYHQAFLAGYPYTCPVPVDFDYNVNKPRVVEASGSLHYRNSRSVDNTLNQVAQIMFVHIK